MKLPVSVVKGMVFPRKLPVSVAKGTVFLRKLPVSVAKGTDRVRKGMISAEGSSLQAHEAAVDAMLLLNSVRFLYKSLLTMK